VLSARQHAEAGRYDDALGGLQRVLDSRRSRLGDTDLRTARAQHELGAVLADAGRLRAAEEALCMALSLKVLHLGDGHASVAATLHELARLYALQGRAVEALRHAMDAVSVLDRLPRVQPLPLAALLADAAAAQTDTGNFAHAEIALQRALALRVQVLGPAHPSSAMLTLRAAVLAAEHMPARASEASAHAASALRSVRAQLGAEHVLSAWGLDMYARTLAALGRHQQALDVGREAVRAAQGHHRDHPALLVTLLLHFSDAHVRVNRPAAAEPVLQQALSVVSDRLGAQHPLAVAVLHRQAQLELVRGHPSGALVAARAGVAACLESLGRSHPAAAMLHNACAVALLALGDPGTALAASRDAVSILGSMGDHAWRGLAASLQNEAAALVRLQQFGDALPVLQRAVLVRRSALGEDDPVARELARDADRCATLTRAQQA
jgi:tetratricopeptide (TPR) repeat protein